MSYNDMENMIRRIHLSEIESDADRGDQKWEEALTAAGPSPAGNHKAHYVEIS